MTRYGEILEKLNPLKRAQYYGFLQNIWDKELIFGPNDDCQRIQENLGLTPTELKKAITWLVDKNMISVDYSSGVVVISLTDLAREEV